jgi:hypothetical protein
MDRHHLGAQRRRSFAVRLVAWTAAFVILAPAGGTGAQAGDLDAWATAFPATMDRDLAAMALSPADYPVAGMVAGRGHLLRPVEEAAAHATVLGMSQEDVLLRMRDAGWIARYIGEVGPAIVPDGNAVPTTGWSSITAYEDAVGAAEGFALLDESGGDGVEVIQAPPIGDGARLTRYTGTDSEGRPFDRLRYTFVSGPLVGSVALFRGADTPEAAMTPDAMVTMAERLLARMQAISETPGLPQLVVRLDPTSALPVDTHNEAYYVLDGVTIPHQGDSAEAIEAAEEFNARYGVDASYIAHTTFDGQEGVLQRPTWLVALYRVESAGTAADLVGQHARYDRSVGYDELVELDALPAVGGPVAGSAYTEAWEDGSVNEGYRITVAVGDVVAIVDVSAPGGVSQNVAYALVEAQAACLEIGMCTSLQAPFAPVSGLATPAA